MRAHTSAERSAPENRRAPAIAALELDATGSPPGPALPDLGPALQRVAEDGFAGVRAAVGRSWLGALADELGNRQFWPLPPTTRIHQCADQHIVTPSGSAPVTAALAAALGAAVRSGGPEGAGLEAFTPTQATCLRYRGSAAGIGPHQDGKNYLLVVAVFTIRGRAPFSVVTDRTGHHVVDRWTTRPGDLCLLRGPGFAGHDDGRPWHCVGGPGPGERLALVLRMTGRLPAVSR